MEGWKAVAMIHGALICVQIIFSGNQIASKIGMRYFHPSIFLLTRCAIVSPIMFLLAKLKEKEVLPKSRRELLLLIGMAFCSFLSFETFIFGMQITSVATGTTLQATSPLWTLLIALALKMEGPSFMKIGGVICAILGAVISVAGNQLYLKLSGDGSQSVSQNSDFPGGLLLVANAMCYSGFVTLQKYVLRTVKPLTCTAWNITICAVFVFFVAMFFVDTVDLGAVTLEGWLSVVYVSLLAMATAYALLSWAANQTSTTVIAVYSTVMPVLSPIMSFFILRESVSIIQIVGMCVTVSGVFLVICARYAEEKKRKLLELSSSTTTTDDVSITNDTDKLLLGQKGIEMDEMDNNRVAITFGVTAVNGNEWSIEDSDDENNEKNEKNEGRKNTKGGYAIVSTNINESDGLNTGLVVASA